MKTMFPLLTACAILLALPSSPSAQTVTLAGDMLRDWQQQKATMIAIADAMPPEKFGYKSTPAQRSYGEQIMHAVQVSQVLLTTLGGKTPVPAINLKATSKPDIMQALRQSYDYGEAVFKEFNDAAWTTPVAGPRFVGQATRTRIANFAMTHAMDIYGQMAVYLRLNGIVPPASRSEM